MKKNDKALKYFEQASKLQDLNPKLLYKMAQCYEKTKQIEAAIAYYSSVIEITKFDWETPIISLCSLLVQLEQYEKAKDLIDKLKLKNQNSE